MQFIVEARRKESFYRKFRYISHNLYQAAYKSANCYFFISDIRNNTDCSIYIFIIFAYCYFSILPMYILLFFFETKGIS